MGWVVWCAAAGRVASEYACPEPAFMACPVSALACGASSALRLCSMLYAVGLAGGYCLGASGGGAGVHGAEHGYLAWMGQADQGSGRVQYGQSISPSSVSVVEGVVGDEPAVRAVVSGDWFGGGTAWAVVGFVGEAVAEGEDVDFVVVELECFPHGYRVVMVGSVKPRMNDAAPRSARLTRPLRTPNAASATSTTARM
jgi:hypothetical protein